MNHYTSFSGNVIVIILPPHGASRADFEATIRRHLDSPEFVDIPSAVADEPVTGPEHLPLWRWFLSSK